MRRWLVLILMVAAVSSLFTLARLPTPLLFGGLAGALLYAPARPQAPLRLPDSWFQAGQAVVGVIVGASMDWHSLGALGPRWLVVVGISCFSLVVSVLVGRLLIRRGASPATATFASVAGGAAGLTAMADDLGADARVVAVLQYLRLLVVLVTMPLVVTLVFGAREDGPALGVTGTDWRVDAPFVAAAVACGLLAGRLLRLPSAAILGPLLVAALLTLVPFFEGAAVPPVVEALGYLVIGVQVGLKFTAASLRAIGRMLPTALLTIVVTLVACAGLGWVLTVTTDASPLDAYLATTPGGIYAVLGIAAATDGDVAFVAAAQMLRLLIVLASAPLIAAYLRRAAS
ncbi:AbrB family transcriptional regulator [Mycolicibacterium austroafricanum]|uniref:AbrB family transcriptional regulator n=1 Tax=Mycolicibacterium austroafricanum TaxID=39687 RepID=UPI001CA34A8F|nr:AbrB family transcriptional regulator [Mycolicibacterium austroafricanum]QZT54508.1 AbrB family transcriptional regulator [Mycolicibacterium austroafricanum]